MIANRWFLLTPQQRLIISSLTICLITCVLLIFNLQRGEPDINLSQFWTLLIFEPLSGQDDTAYFLLHELRLPRAILTLACGLALGMAGVLMQDSLRNPLADPSLLGIAQGASFTMALAYIYPEWVPDIPLPFLSLLSAFCVGLMVLASCGSIRNTSRMILAGAICSGFFGVLTSAVILLSPPDRLANGLGDFLRYTAGSFSNLYWEQLKMIAPWLIFALPIAWFSGRTLNLLQLGDEMAISAGLNPRQARIILLLLALVLVAPVLASAGPIAFIALFAPHIARGLLAKSDARYTLLVSALSGALLLCAADTLGRLLLFPLEVPAGIWTIVLIGPLAIALIGRRIRN